MDGIPFQIPVPTNSDYTLAYDWPYGGSVSQLRINCTSGSGACSVLINGVKVTGIDTMPIAANTRSEHQASGLNVFVPGDDIVLRIESGAGSLSNVFGTLVVTNRTIFEVLEAPPVGTIYGQIAMTGGLSGAIMVTIPFNPPLRRTPLHIFNGIFVKNDPSEDDVFVLDILPIMPNDLTFGWSYILSGPSVSGQVLRYSYIP